MHTVSDFKEKNGDKSSSWMKLELFLEQYGVLQKSFCIWSNNFWEILPDVDSDVA